jgi:hypothetical protein
MRKKANPRPLAGGAGARHFASAGSGARPNHSATGAQAPGTLPSFEDALISDRNFFALRPGRRYRVRRAFPSEAEFSVSIGGGCVPPVGKAHFVFVEQVRPGVRIRSHFIDASDLETDLSDADAELMLRGLS